MSTHKAFDKFTGKWIAAQPGFLLAWMPLGDASVLVEYELIRADGDGKTSPRTQDQISVLCVLINGRWCDADDVIPTNIINGWEEELLRSELEAA